MAKNFQRKDQQTKASIINAKATVLKRAVESGPSLRNMVFHSPERNYDALNAVRMLKEFACYYYDHMFFRQHDRPGRV